MYLHLGQEISVPIESIIGVFDLEVVSQAKITRAYLTRAEKGGKVCNVSEDLPRSFVVCREGEKETVYISAISSATLYKRVEQGQF